MKGRFLFSIFLCLFFSNLLLFAQENPETPILSGRIVDQISLPSETNAVIFLVVQDEEEKIWLCKIQGAELLQEAREYQKEDQINVYGIIIDEPNTRHIEVKKIEKKPVATEK